MIEKKEVRHIDLEDTVLNVIMDTRRIKLADCDAYLRIFEEKTEIPTLGRSYSFKKRYAVLTICEDPQTTMSVEENLLRSISSFELIGSIRCADGTLKELHLQVLPYEIDLTGDWIFEVPDTSHVKEWLAL